MKISDDNYLRVWVDSEKTPGWMKRRDQFRILKNNKVYKYKKIWWKFGKWEILYENTKHLDVCVKDKGIIRFRRGVDKN